MQCANFGIKGANTIKAFKTHHTKVKEVIGTTKGSIDTSSSLENIYAHTFTRLKYNSLKKCSPYQKGDMHRMHMDNLKTLISNRTHICP